MAIVTKRWAQDAVDACRATDEYANKPTAKSWRTSAADFEVPPEFAANPHRNFKIASGLELKFAVALGFPKFVKVGQQVAHELRKAGNRYLDADINSRQCFALRGDGGKKARSPGRPRRKPLKPFARGMPERFSANLR